jgi:hypothetical protein
MTTYYHPQPLNSDTLYLTDVVPDAVLILHDGIDLPCFAAFDLLKDATGTDRLREYYLQYIDLALEYGNSGDSLLIFNSGDSLLIFRK